VTFALDDARLTEPARTEILCRDVACFRNQVDLRGRSAADANAESWQISGAINRFSHEAPHRVSDPKAGPQRREHLIFPHLHRHPERIRFARTKVPGHRIS
jgi:hypothetical protein